MGTTFFRCRSCLSPRCGSRC
ncbi:MAG: hypothetical protein EBY81_06955 [Verrucomicrobia bacterium]|nr:hypothetical protein [Verrucomicrobiota bacterium]